MFKSGDVPVNINDKKLNSLFVTNLIRCEYKKEYEPALRKLLIQKIKERVSKSVGESKLLKKIYQKMSQLDKVEEKFILSQIPQELYDKYTSKYKEELNLLNKNLANYEIDASNLENALEKCLLIAQNISSAWLSSSFDIKQRLHRLVFPEGILVNKKEGLVRTPRINVLFAEMEPLKRVLEENKNGNSIKNCLKSSKEPRIETYTHVRMADFEYIHSDHIVV